MGLPITFKKEALSEAYVRAVVAKAGFNFGSYGHDMGIDGIIKDVKEINGGFRASGFGIEFQLKSTCDVTFENGELVYDLEAKNYNDLVSWEGGNPAILILFVMPNDLSAATTDNNTAVYRINDTRSIIVADGHFTITNDDGEILDKIPVSAFAQSPRAGFRKIKAAIG